MDAFYEESAINQNAKRGARNYKILHYFSWAFFIIATIFAVIAFMFFPLKPTEEGRTPEEYQGALNLYPSALAFFFFLAGTMLFFTCLGFMCYFFKRRLNVQYDYSFVSGELRITKVFNINRRKFLESIAAEDIQQIGDVDNMSFERLVSAPGTKLVRYTQNVQPAEGKFFMYILANNGGKKLYLLECRELLLMNIMKFARRSALESDYVMQEKKQK